LLKLNQVLEHFSPAELTLNIN